MVWFGSVSKRLATQPTLARQEVMKSPTLLGSCLCGAKTVELFDETGAGLLGASSFFL